MTVVAAVRDKAEPQGPSSDLSAVEPRPTGWRGLWHLPLLAHAALAAALLAVAALWIGPGSSFTSDEGASVLQAQALEHGKWVVADPLARLDPAGSHYPVELAAGGAKGYAPLGKHLFYGLLLGAVGRVAGVSGMVGLSILGSVLAALLAAALSRELGPGAERITFWFVVAGTPLLFDGFLVVGQAVAASLVAASALLTLRYLRGGGSWCLVAVAVCCAAGCLLRTEAVLWCLGLAGAALATAGWTRPGRTRGLSVAAVAVIVSAIAREADSHLTREALGATQSVIGAPAGGHSVTNQLHAFYVSWLQSTADPFSSVGAWVVVSLVVMAAAARMVIRGRVSGWGLMAAATGALAVWAVRVITDPTSPVSGLASAAPVLWVGIWLIDRQLLRTAAARFCALAAAGFAALVLATQYGDGGGAQWGGRFFAIVLPVVAPVAVAAIRSQRGRVDRRTATYLGAVGATLTLLLSAGALASLRASHSTDARLASAIERSAATAPAAGDGGLPVYITSFPAVPRLEWQVFDDVRWQLVPLPDMPSMGRILRGAGISTFTLVTADPQFEVPDFSRTFAASAARPVLGLDGWYLVRFRAL